MRQNGSPKAKQATASRVETTHTKSIFATDLSEGRPVSAEHRRRLTKNLRTIWVGHREDTPFGTLRCLREGDDVVVSLSKRARLVGRRLILRGAASLKGPLREADFSVEVDEFIGTPWHEVEYTSLWTVHGLRTKGEMESQIDG